MKKLDTLYANATSFRSAMRYPTDAKCNNMQIEGISFLKKLSLNPFNEGSWLKPCVKPAEKFCEQKTTNLGGDCSFSDNGNRTFCNERGIETSFSQKGKEREVPVAASLVKKELARVRAIAMEGSFGTQKEHYGLKRINCRFKCTENLMTFFGIHTANVALLAIRIAKAQQQKAA